MDLHQLKTFITVAREGSVTRASALLHLSQPAVSAHIKAMEDALELTLFERNARGMSLTHDGRRLLVKAEQTLAAHQELIAEASRGKSELTGVFRLGAGVSSNPAIVGKLLTALAARCPGVEVVLKHRTSKEVLDGIRDGTLDAGFYNEPTEPDSDLATTEADRFSIHLVAAKGSVLASSPPNWKAIAEQPWIYATESACCRRTAEGVFTARGFKPKRVISADRQEVICTLVASGIGLGLLHADAAREAVRRGELELLHELEPRVRVLFACLASRNGDPVLTVASEIMREKPPR